LSAETIRAMSLGGAGYDIAQVLDDRSASLCLQIDGSSAPSSNPIRGDWFPHRVSNPRPKAEVRSAEQIRGALPAQGAALGEGQKRAPTRRGEG